MKNIIFLDIDGVLITNFPIWKIEEKDGDAYSKFNDNNLKNFKRLLDLFPHFKIVISSARRVSKSLERLEEIFSYRGISGKIIGKIPDETNIILSRDKELQQYIDENQVENFVIIDDDKSVLNLSEKYLKNVVLTEYKLGFTEVDLEKAKMIMKMFS